MRVTCANISWCTSANIINGVGVIISHSVRWRCMVDVMRWVFLGFWHLQILVLVCYVSSIPFFLNVVITARKSGRYWKFCVWCAWEKMWQWCHERPTLFERVGHEIQTNRWKKSLILPNSCHWFIIWLVFSLRAHVWGGFDNIIWARFSILLDPDWG